MPDVDGRVIARYREGLEQGTYHPLDGDSTSGFLRRLVTQLSPKGEFVGQGELRGEANHPRLGRDAVVFMRTRTLGFATGLQAILEELQQRDDLPSSLLNIVGVEPPPPAADADEAISTTGDGNEDEHVLLSKPANREQLQIARRLDRYGCVLVQGPPGTGKTHTIANLLGHLLAQGKRVLVTSHTTKALRVLRQQVVEQLQPLCVSVLENDAGSREQLKGSIEAIVERLSSSDADRLGYEAHTFQRQRGAILTRIREVRQQIIAARANEYRDVVVAGQGYTPSEAARTVSEGRGRHDWIPGPVRLGAPLPLSAGELIELYRTNTAVTPEDERELATVLPNPSDLPDPVEFERLMTDRTRLARKDLQLRQDLWSGAPKDQEPRTLEDLLQRLTQAAHPLHEMSGWRFAAIAAGRGDGIHREPWDKLLALIGTVYDTAAQTENSMLQYGHALA